MERPLIVNPPYPLFGGAALIGPRGDLLGVGSLSLGGIAFGDERVPGTMFIPIDELKSVMDSLLENGRSAEPSRPWLGIFSEERNGLLMVTRLAEESPAALAGLSCGDIITSVGGKPVASLIQFYQALWSQGDAGVEVTITLLRASEFMDVTVQSEDRYSWYRIPSS